MGTPLDLASVLSRAILAARWPDGGIDGFPSNTVTTMIVQQAEPLIREAVATWLESDALTVDLARLVQEEDSKHYAAGSLNGLGGHDAVPFILSALTEAVRHG
jgi:hypothetical protein